MQLPGPVRAFVGLLAVTAEEAKHLPDRAIELPMLAVSSALQMSLRAQQRYARLAARGDDVINRRPTGDEPPGWATFDAPVSDGELRAIGLSDPDPGERARAASQLLDELLSGVESDRAAGPSAEPTTAVEPTPPAEPTPITAAKKSAASPAKKPPAKSSPNRTSPSRLPAAKKQPGTKPPAKRTAKKPADKAINAPRHTAPSRFDTVEDD
jgi:hypothetical protein